MVLCTFSVCIVSASAENIDLAETGFSPVNLGNDFYAYVGFVNSGNRWLTVSAGTYDIVADPAVNNASQTWHFVRSGSCYKILDAIDGFNLKPVNGVFDLADVFTTTYTDNNLWTIEQDGSNYLIHPATDQSFFLFEDTTSPEHRVRLMSDPSYKNKALVKINKAVTTAATKNAPVVTAGNAVNGVNLKWTADATVNAFRIARFNDTTGNWDILKETAAHAYTDTTVNSGKTYRYYVQGIEPIYSEKSIKEIRYIAAPKLTGVNNTASGPVVSWKASAGAQAYRVFCNEGSGWNPIGDTTGTSLTHKGFSYNKKYLYTVRCITANGKKFTSAFDTKGVENTIVKTPSVKSTLKPNGYYLTWNKVTGAAKYRIFINCKATGWKWVKVIDTANLSYSFTNTMNVAKFRMNNGESYCFTVRCLDGSGKLVSGFKSTSKLVYYDAPKITSIKSYSTYNNIQWKAVKGASKYKVFAWNGKKWVTKGTLLGTSFNAKKTGSAMQNKTYAVRALNKSGQFISSYWEAYGTGGDIHYYSSGAWTSKNQF